MLSTKNISILIVFLFAVSLLFGGTAMAEYPDETVNYIVTFNPGGESDLTARMQQGYLEEILGTDVVISYTIGGGGAVGWAELINSEPDGYTIAGYNIPHIILQPLMRDSTGYESLDFADIALFQFTPNILAVPEDSDMHTLEDFVNKAKEIPEALTVGGSGSYSANHLGSLILEQAADINVTYIPFTGSGAAIPAFMGGHVSALMTYTTMAKQYEDEMRVLAVAAEERVASLPDVPTFKELGYDYVEGAYRGIAAPPGTPEDRIAVLTDAARQVNEHPEFKEWYLENGFVNVFYGPEEAEALISDRIEVYTELLTELGLLD